MISASQLVADRGASVATALIAEIERVSAKRERWRGYAQEAGPQACFNPAITLMTASIEAAKQAMADGDAQAAIAALQDLRGYDDGD